jgi:predicted NBD/HSP70 family sugar kinase
MLVAVDVGGTKIAVQLFNPIDGSLETREYKTISLNPGSLHFADSLVGILEDLITAPCEGIGFAFKGLVHKGIIQFASLLGGEVNFDMNVLLKKKFSCDTLIENDLRPLLISEKEFGFGRGCDSFVVINIGTGLSIASWDHVCIGGYRSCAGQLTFHTHYCHSTNSYESIEKLISGKGLSQRGQSALSISTITTRDVLAADSGSALYSIQNEFYFHFIKLLQEISFFFNPEKIILTGSVTKSIDVERIHDGYFSSTDKYSLAQFLGISDIQYGNCTGILHLLKAKIL